jgi:hypothetical protein
MFSLAHSKASYIAVHANQPKEPSGKIAGESKHAKSKKLNMG